jgi:hypothetical protein
VSTLSSYTVLRTTAALVLGALLAGAQVNAQMPRPKSLEELVTYMQAHHMAPFDREGAVLPPGGQETLMQHLAKLGNPSMATLAAAASTGTNVKVNRDRNPWPKAEIGLAVDPMNGKNFVVMSNDFRENFDRQFFHVSTNGGTAWSDDVMAIGLDPVTEFAPYSFQSDPGVAFDDKSQSYLSTIAGNSFVDPNVEGVYANFDTQVEEVQGFAGGTYASLVPTSVDNQICSGATTFVCPAQLDKPLITVDAIPGSPKNGTIYVYYTLFCNDQPCTDGSAKVPAFSSAILELHGGKPAILTSVAGQRKLCPGPVFQHGDRQPRYAAYILRRLHGSHRSDQDADVHLAKRQVESELDARGDISLQRAE